MKRIKFILERDCLFVVTPTIVAGATNRKNRKDFGIGVFWFFWAVGVEIDLTKAK